MADAEQLQIPAAVRAAESEAELASIWLADGQQIMTLSPRMWDDPAAWGLMLVDMVRHIADAYQARGYDRSMALAAIKAAMEAEWANPTI